MQWQFEGKTIELEKWRWEAVYPDSILKQFDDDGQFHQLREIDQSRLIAFRMVSDNQTLTLKFSPGMKLIHYYENYVFQVGTLHESKLRVYCFGYQRGHEKVINMIFPNEIITTNDPEKVKV